jgi:hypothetical protein
MAKRERVALWRMWQEATWDGLRLLRSTATQRRVKKERLSVNVNDAFPSNYIKASDLGDKKVAVVIDRVEMETLGRGRDAETKPVVYFENKQKGLVLNKTNAKRIIEIVGSAESDEWSGHTVVLYATETEFGGDTVSCVRILAPPKARQTTPTKPAPPKPKPAPAQESAREPGADEGEFQADDSDVPF